MGVFTINSIKLLLHYRMQQNQNMIEKNLDSFELEKAAAHRMVCKELSYIIKMLEENAFDTTEMTTKEVAELLKVNPTTVTRLAAEKKIKGVKRSGWFFNIADIIEYQKKRIGS